MSPDHLEPEDVREYQMHLLNERRLSAATVNQFVSAANFLYYVTLETCGRKGLCHAPACPINSP